MYHTCTLLQYINTQKYVFGNLDQLSLCVCKCIYIRIIMYLLEVATQQVLGCFVSR